MLPCERTKIPLSPVRLIESGDWGLIPIGIGTNVLYGKNRCELFANGSRSDLMLRRKARKSFIESAALLALGLGLASCSSDTAVGNHALTFNLKLSRDTASLYAGRTLHLTAVLKDENGNIVSGTPIVWASSSNDVVTVSNDGLVTATKFGTATISATAQQVGATATISVLHDPIIFVHGFEASGAIWTLMIDRL